MNSRPRMPAAARASTTGAAPSSTAERGRCRAKEKSGAYIRCTRRMNQVSFSSSSWLVDTGRSRDESAGVRVSESRMAPPIAKA